jgi:hypothetical protein
MRRILLPLLLLQAVGLFAQPAVGPEVVSDPLQTQSVPSRSAVPAVAMAKDRTGIAIAWLMSNPADGGDRIYIARLDATAHIIGSVHQIPMTLTGDSLEAMEPSLAPAPGGDGFALVWRERPLMDLRPEATRAVYCALDSDLKPSAPIILSAYSRSISSPAIVRSGKSTWISADALAWQVQADGSITGPLDAGLTASDMAITTDFPQLVSGQSVVTSTTCRPEYTCIFWGRTSSGCLDSCKINHYSYILQFVSLYTLSTSKLFAFESAAAPAIGSDGHDAIVVWFRGAQLTGGDVVATRLQPSAFAGFPQATDEPRVLGTFGGDAGVTRPDIASDGEHYVIVWRARGTQGERDIVGASIDRAGNVIPLSIATSLADERDPSVIALGPGKFLVAYEKVSDVDRRIAGRFVTFENRSRAVR